jgi:putative flippase GtrA
MRDLARFSRFVASGLAATAVHFAALFVLHRIVGIESAGASNALASIPGITASFLGNRYFVFRALDQTWTGQAGRFVALYTATALMHGLVLFLWTDMAGLDYRVGFILATTLQVGVSYVANRTFVFRS